MEVLLGYLLGIGTVIGLARRGADARNAVAWTARQVGAFSGKVSASLHETARVAREEYERGRVEELAKPPAEGLGAAVDDVGSAPKALGEKARGAQVSVRLNGN